MELADRWTVRGPAGDVAPLLRRAADVIDELAAGAAVRQLGFDRDGDDIVLTVGFDHWQLPADLDYLHPRVAGDGDGDGHYSDGQRDDVDFMVGLASALEAATVVDLGCGTGQLAVALAADGRRVIAVDPAKAMLDVARTRDGADLVEWICGGAHAIGARDADLVVMTGNIPSIFVTDEAWDAVLEAVHGALRPGGHLALGGWNPGDRPWERWDLDVVVVDAGDGVRVRTGGPHIELAGGRETLVAGSEWRYRTPEEMTASLARAGFVVDHAYGDWRRSPLTPTSRDIVLVAHRH